MTKTRLLILCLLFFLFNLPRPAYAQGGDDSILVVTLVDSADKPLAGEEITLILIRYGELAVETEAYAVCETDKAGQCTFEVSDPPRLADGSTEAYLDVTDIGRRWINWQGERVEVTLKVSDLELLATVSVPNEQGYEYETPGAYNSPLYTESPATPTEPAITHTPRYTESPATPTEPTTHTLQTQLPDELPEKQDDLQNSTETKGFRVGVLPIASGVVFAVILVWILRVSYVRRGRR